MRRERGGAARAAVGCGRRDGELRDAELRRFSATIA